MVNPLIGFPNWAWDIIALIITFLLFILFIGIIVILRKAMFITAYGSGKVIQTFAGPLFLVCWLLFSNDINSKYFAAVVPFLFMILFIAIGTDLLKNKEIVRTMSREGKPRDLLKGPLFYTIVMLLATLFLWYTPFHITGGPIYYLFIPTAFLIFGPLTGGVGFAGLIGRRYGKHRFKVFSNKSVEGSLAMFLFSLLFTFGLLGIFWLILNPIWSSWSLHFRPTTYGPALIAPIFIVTLVTSITEVFSPAHFDNLLIPLVAILTIFRLAFPFPYLIWHYFPLP
jgi:phytol kinase